jgi:hypothetical protein
MQVFLRSGTYVFSLGDEKRRVLDWTWHKLHGRVAWERNRDSYSWAEIAARDDKKYRELEQ